MKTSDNLIEVHELAAEAPQHVTAEHMWTVIVEIRRPDSASYHVHPTVYPAVCDKVAELGGAIPALRMLDRSVVVSYRAQAVSMRQAHRDAELIIDQICFLLNLPATAVIAQRVLSNEDLGALLGAPAAPPPSVVGLSEAAEIVGVSRQRMHQLAAQPDFPRPLRHLKAGPVWLEDQVLDYARVRRSLAFLPPTGAARAPASRTSPVNRTKRPPTRTARVGDRISSRS